MPIFLSGLALQFYRGIGQDVQKLSAFKDFNFFIGANNAGKSSVLNFISKFLGPARPNKSQQLDSLERFSGGTRGQPVAAIGVSLEHFIKNAIERAPKKNAEELIRKIAPLFAEGGVVWMKCNVPLDGHYSFLAPPTPQYLARQLGPEEWQRFWISVTTYVGGGSLEQWIVTCSNYLLNAQSISFPRVDLIPAFRQVGPKSQTFDDFSGRGLIDRLAEIQSPDHDRRSDRVLFDKINQFLQTVASRDEAKIEIPHHREHILVHMDNKILPLASLGTGIHEVIMIAAFCTLSQQQIVCIEEPEIHLHPILQRRLITYLQEQTSNQYFIATHSPSFIDTPGAAIFHVTHDGIQTRIQETVLRKDKHAICVDLGTRASDIVQANCIIWVEGPSDRIYIRHWIRALAPELIEGIHYSIMFYGGRLLSHLTASDDEITEFIELRSLNRNLAVIIDSDKATAESEINDTKKRLQDELSKKPAIVWITAGREIENYVDHKLLQSSLKVVHPTIYAASEGGGNFDHPLYFKRTDSKTEQNADKVKVARLVCEQPADLTKLDLKDRVTELVQMILDANK